MRAEDWRGLPLLPLLLLLLGVRSPMAVGGDPTSPVEAARARCLG